MKQPAISPSAGRWPKKRSSDKRRGARRSNGTRFEGWLWRSEWLAEAQPEARHEAEGDQAGTKQ